MEEERYLNKGRVLDEITELEFQAREELVQLEKAYENMKLQMEALDESCIKLDGQIEMILRAKSRLRTLDSYSTLPEE